MEDNTTDINLIIIHYLDGSATIEEKTTLLQWLKESVKNRNDFTDIKDLWLLCNTVSDNELEVDIALDRLKLRIISEHERMNKKPGWSFKSWYQVAAVLLILLGSAYWLNQSGIWSHPTAVIQNQLITAKGSKGKFTLPDGTIVWLNSESRLVYPDVFEAGKRVVSLSGGAYFEVTRNEKEPFIVQTGAIDVEVLGTSFNVSAYPYKEDIETALLNGSVRISGKAFKESILLKPGEVFEYQKENKSSFVKSANTNLYADWIKDRLVFDNAPLSDIIISMEGWYAMEINCPDKFAQTTRMSFTIRQENINEILKAMSYIVPINYQVEEGKVQIIPDK